MLGLHLVLLALHELFTIRISYLVILTKVFNSYYYFKCLCTNLQLATYPNTYKLDPPPKKNVCSLVPTKLVGYTYEYIICITKRMYKGC